MFFFWWGTLISFPQCLVIHFRNQKICLLRTHKAKFLWGVFNSVFRLDYNYLMNREDADAVVFGIFLNRLHEGVNMDSDWAVGLIYV